MNWTDASTGNNDHLMSPAFVYNKANAGFDSGSSLSGNMNVIRTVGNAIWSEMPYDDGDPISWGDEGAWRSAPQFRGRDYTWTDQENIDVMKGWIAEGYVLPIALDAGNYGRGLGAGDDIINSTEHIRGSPNHANTIVAYNDSKSDDGETGAFKIVNSWGSGWGASWGGNGYYWMTYEALKEIPWPVFRFRDIIDHEPSLLGVWTLDPQGGRDARVTLGVGPRNDPQNTREPWWRGGNHDFPAFMALDYTDFKNEWRMGHSLFFLDVGPGTDYSTITSFKMELYEGGYSPGSYTRISDESPDVPEDTPGYVTVSIYPSMRITNPLDGDNVNTLVNITGWATNPLWTVVLREDFEGSWPGDWTLGDALAAGGEDYWGPSNYTSYDGDRSGWSAQSGEFHEIAHTEDFDFGGVLPLGWTTYSAGPDIHPWEMKLEGGSDYIAECNSTEAGPGTDITEWLQMTSSFDASVYASLNLTFYLDYQDFDGDEYASVLYSDSANFPAFMGLQTWLTKIMGSQSVDLSVAAGDSEVYLAFLYHGTYDRHMRVDDVEVIGGRPNEDRRLYEPDMDAFMHQDVDLSMYDSATLMYKYWLDTEDGVDILSVTYYDGSWHLVDPHTGSSDGWQASTISIPTTATKIGFQFLSNDNTEREGAYVDDVLLLGHGAIDDVYVKIDNSSWMLANGTTQWYYEWNTSSLTEGYHTIYAKANFGSNSTQDLVKVTIDHSLPTNPDSHTSSHIETVWSSDTTVWIRWSGHWDNISGVYGFALVWDTDPSTVPAEIVATTDRETTSAPLADGNSWYVHIRTVDNAGNWAAGAYHAGPFYIDASPPNNPNSYTSSHQVGIWSSDNTIYIEYLGASDPLSGVRGYSITWSTMPNTLPLNVMSTVTTNTTSFPLATGDSWYFHARTLDNAGNWAPDAYHVGPFYIDTIGPSTTHLYIGMPGQFSWFLSNVSVVITAADGHSGINVTVYSIDGSPWSEYISPVDVATDGNHTIEYYSQDAVENNETIRSGNLKIDATPPLNPDSYTSSHTVGTWSGDDTIDINWSGAWDETSGVYGYSFIWTRNPSTLPGPVTNSTSESTTSPSLQTGNDWYFHVRTRDVAGNWAADAYHVGPFGIDASPPTTLDDVWADLEGTGWRDVNVSWTPAFDVESGLQRYDVYYSTTYDSDGAGYAILASVLPGTTHFVHSNAGEGDPSTYFYMVMAVDLANNSAPYQNQAGKFTKQLAAGWQLISIPLEQRNESLEVLRTLDFDVIRSYSMGSWKSYYPQKTYCDLRQITADMGMWIHVASDSNLTLAGKIPAITSITLRRGWNLVGYPSFNTYTVADLKADMTALRVEVYDEFSPPYFLRIADDFEVLTAGMGYWVKVSQAGTWIVINEAGGPQEPKDSTGEGLTSIPPDIQVKSEPQPEVATQDEDSPLTEPRTDPQNHIQIPVFLLMGTMFIGLAIPFVPHRKKE
jgi:hypothetical protein